MSILEKLKKDAGSTQGINCGVMLMQNGLSRSLKPIDIILCNKKRLNKLCAELEMEILKNTDIKKYNKMLEEIEIFGERQKYRKRLTIDQIRDVRNRRKNGEKVDKIAERYCVSGSTISSITIWVSYADIDPHLKDSYIAAYGDDKPKLFGGDVVESIRDLIKRGYKRSVIAKKIGIDPILVTKTMANFGITRNAV